MLGFIHRKPPQRTLLDLIAEDAFKSAEQRDADLETAYETLLDTVWRLEREWTFDDRIRHSG